MEHPASAPTVDRDGCDCPPYVLRCCHLESTLLWLTDNDSDCDVCALDFFPPESLYSVVEPADDAIYCEACLDMAAKQFHLATDDYDEALAAFYEAEQALLRGAE